MQPLSLNRASKVQKFYEVEVQLRRYPPKSSFLSQCTYSIFLQKVVLYSGKEWNYFARGGKKVVSMQVTLSSFYRRSIVVPKHLLELAQLIVKLFLFCYCFRMIIR